MLDSVSPRSPSCLRPLPIAIAIALTGAAATAQSGLGAAAEYALLGLTNGTVSVNSASTVVGDFGYSAGVTSTTNQKIGGSVGTWTGTAYVHSAVAAFQAHPTNYAPSGGIVTSAAEDARLDQANADAVAASAAIAALTPTQTFGVIDDTSVVAGGVDGLPSTHVIRIGKLSMNSDVLELRGDADDTILVNVLGDFTFSQSTVLLVGGITPARVIFNFVAGGAFTRNVLVNKSASVFRGTILAPDLNGFEVEYHNPATFAGAIIARRIKVHSSFNLTHVPFSGTICVGDPAFVHTDLPACGTPIDPVLTTTLPTLGSVLAITLTSSLPDSPAFLAAAFGPPVPFAIPGTTCTIWVDLATAFEFVAGTTDPLGSWTILLPLPNDPMLIGFEFTLQARVCQPSIPGPIPGLPDFLSNGAHLRLGCE